jgi:hypothetical protein
MGVDLGNLKSSLKRVSINPSSSFLSGGSTSLFSGGDVIVGSVVNPFLPAGPLPDVQELASQISTKLISHVTSYATSYVTSKMTALLTPPTPADLTSRAMTYISAYMENVADILKKLTSTEEALRDIKAAKININVMGFLQQIISTVTAEVQKKISYLIGDTVPQWMQNVVSYISQGPKWVQAQVDMIDDYACGQVAQYVGEQSAKLFKQKEDMLNKLAEAEAKKLAKIANDKLFDKLSQKLKVVQQKKIAAINAAKAVVKAALLELKAMLGL